MYEIYWIGLNPTLRTFINHRARFEGFTHLSIDFMGIRSESSISDHVHSAICTRTGYFLHSFTEKASDSFAISRRASLRFFSAVATFLLSIFLSVSRRVRSPRIPMSVSISRLLSLFSNVSKDHHFFFLFVFFLFGLSFYLSQFISSSSSAAAAA